MEGQPIDVVLVEDNDTFRQALELMLGLTPDVRVVAAVADGESALSVCPGLQPDVVLVDYRLPGLDGVETTTALRAALPEDGGGRPHRGCRARGDPGALRRGGCCLSDEGPRGGGHRRGDPGGGRAWRAYRLTRRRSSSTRRPTCRRATVARAGVSSRSTCASATERRGASTSTSRPPSSTASCGRATSRPRARNPRRPTSPPRSKSSPATSGSSASLSPRSFPARSRAPSWRRRTSGARCASSTRGSPPGAR